MLRILSLATLLLSTAALGAMPEMGNGYGAIDAPRDTDPVTLAERFCAARISGDMTPLQPFFAPKLKRLLDGLPEPGAAPWQGYIDRPTACDVEVVNGYDDTIGVLVRVTYTSAERRWSDTLNFERTPDSWRLNNVFYEQGGNLRFRLVEGTNG